MMKVRVVIEGTAYDVEIVDLSARPVIAIVEGERFEVWPEASPISAIGSPDGSRLPAPPVPSPAPGDSDADACRFHTGEKRIS
jgi:hypothetical protein